MPKVSLSLLRKTLLTVFLVSLSFSAGYLFGLKGFQASVEKFPQVVISRELPPERKTLDFSLFWRVWDTLEAKYFDRSKLIASQMIYGAIRGMVASIGDPYTVFLAPEENKVVQEDLSGNFQGVGIQIGFKGTQLAVIAPLSGSPAEKVGVKAGDFIVGIKDEAKKIEMGTIGITLPEAVEAIRGLSGTKVTLTLLRKDSEKPIIVDIIRTSINVPSLTLTYVGSDETLAHVKLLKFSADTENEWEDIVIEILKKPAVSGIILDVRNNPGGYMQGAISLAEEFLGSGNLVVSEVWGNKEKVEYKVERLGRFQNQKVVVLINKGSASASEILAGALRDNKGVKLVGETSFGKGTIQEPEQINGGGGLHITVAKWVTPKGYWVNDKGLEPDVKIEDNPETEGDEQLQRAIELLNSQLSISNFK